MKIAGLRQQTIDVINQVSIIGTGNLAWHLAKACGNAGIKINQIIGRNLNNAKLIATEFNTEAADINSELIESDLYIICVKDEAIRQTAEIIWRPGYKMVHTSGATSSDRLNFGDNHYGAFWPMQTLVKGNEINYREMLVCITGSDIEFTNQLKEFGSRTAGRIEIVTDEQRAMLHMTATWVNNFTNHMFDIAETILKDKGLSFELMLPMIRDMMEKVGSAPHASLQTGPAKRNDQATIQKHLELLEKYPEWRELYRVLSDSVTNKFTKQ